MINSIFFVRFYYFHSILFFLHCCCIVLSLVFVIASSYNMSAVCWFALIKKKRSFKNNNFWTTVFILFYVDRVVPADAARWCCYSVSRCCWEGEGAAPPSLSEWRHREWIRRSIQCNPVSLPGSLTQSSAMATAESLLSGTSSVWKLGFSFQSPPLDVDVKSPLTLGNIHTCG